MEQDHVNKEVVPVWRYSPRSRTVRFLIHPASLLFTYTQIFGNNLKNTVLSHVRLTYTHSNRKLTIVTHHLPYPFGVELSPACWRPPAPFTSSFWTVFLPHVVLSEAFQVFVTEFSPAWRKSWSFFRSSMLIGFVWLFGSYVGYLTPNPFYTNNQFYF